MRPTLHQRYLPVPYEPTKVDVKGDWRLAGRNFTIFSAQTDTSGAHYTVTSQVADPTPESLREDSAGGSVPSDVAPSTELPADLPIQVNQLADHLTAGLQTEYDRAAAIQAYLRGPLFHYDLNGAPTGDNALSQFLFDTHRGYCEQFAGAMVVLARIEGIPARVAVGFTPGTQQADGSWLITNHDAHSWPELWFPQAGWVRFEPTPRDASTKPPGYTVPIPGSAATTGPTPTPSAGQSSTPTPSAGNAPRKQERAAPVAGAGGSGHGGSGAVLDWFLGIAAGAVLLLTPAAVRRLRRRRRIRAAGSSPAALWAEILDTALDLGLPSAPNLSPRRLVQSWSRRPDGRAQHARPHPGGDHGRRPCAGAGPLRGRGDPAPRGRPPPSRSTTGVGTLCRRPGTLAGQARAAVGVGGLHDAGAAGSARPPGCRESPGSTGPRAASRADRGRHRLRPRPHRLPATRAAY